MNPREQLDRSISFRNYISIGLGAIVGIGWVVYAGNWIESGGVLGAVLAFLLCGIILIPIGKCYAELTSALPLAGGEVAFSFKAFGSLVAFCTAWALALNYIAITPFETIAIGSLFESIFPGLVTEQLYDLGGYKISVSTILPGVVSGIVLIYLNIRGADWSTGVQSILVGTLLVCATIFVLFAVVQGNIGNFEPLFAVAEVTPYAVFASVISVLVIAPWFMGGFDTIPQAAEEAGISVEPRSLGTAIIASILAGAVFYCLIIAAVGMSVSNDQLIEISSRKNEMVTAEVFRIAFGYEWLAKLVLFAALLGLISTLNGFYIAASRLLFALGRGGFLPHWFAELDSEYHTPKNAILFVGALSLIGPFVGKAALLPIVSSSSFVFTSALLLTCCAAIQLRKSSPELERPYKISVKTMYAGVFVAAVLVLLMIVPGSPGQLSIIEFSIIGIWMFVGLAAYFYRQKTHPMSLVARQNLVLGDYVDQRAKANDQGGTTV